MYVISTLLRYSRSLDGMGEQNYQMICIIGYHLFALLRIIANFDSADCISYFLFGQAHIFLSKLLDICQINL